MKLIDYENLNDSIVGIFRDPIPWDNISRIRDLGDFSKNKVGDMWKDYKLLSLSLNGVIERDIDGGKGKFPTSFDDYQVVEPNDLIFCLYDIDETPRTIGISKKHGMISGSYKVFKCNNKVGPDYLYHFFKSLDKMKLLKQFYTGLRNTIRPERFLNIKIPLPPLPKQNEIVSELISLDEDVNLKTKKLKETISLYKEYEISVQYQKIGLKFKNE